MLSQLKSYIFLPCFSFSRRTLWSVVSLFLVLISIKSEILPIPADFGVQNCRYLLGSHCLFTLPPQIRSQKHFSSSSLAYDHLGFDLHLSLSVYAIFISLGSELLDCVVFLYHHKFLLLGWLLILPTIFHRWTQWIKMRIAMKLGNVWMFLLL